MEWVGKLISAIGGKSTLWGIGITAAIGLSVIGAQEIRYRLLKSDYDVKQADYIRLVGEEAVCAANVVRLTASVERQNLAIQRLATEKAALAAQVRAAALEAQKNRASVAIDEPGVEGMNNFFQRMFR